MAAREHHRSLRCCTDCTASLDDDGTDDGTEGGT
jgi:hypothetical protein